MENGNMDGPVAHTGLNIEREGWLDKQSRHLKRWKARWVVLTEDAKLYTFKDKHIYISPTEIIDFRIYNSVKSSEDKTGRKNSFDVYCSGGEGFSFAADTKATKEDWIRAIGRQIVLSHATSWQEDLP